MKADNYLTLCLEQAANSPLRYRHGCIIVRGGKVIGQGFNDHRAGFNGGTLKTGRLPVRSLDGTALAALKKKHKLKRELKNTQQDETETFTPLESMSGNGKIANIPLSMHSEMMAIHSALSTSSTMASSAVSYQKPYFKLSSDSKRKARLRQVAVKAYVKTVCQAALAQSATKQRTGSHQVQEWRFEGSASQSCAAGSRTSTQGERGHGGASGEQYRETPTEQSELSVSQQWQKVQRTTTQQTTPTVYASADLSNDECASDISGSSRNSSKSRKSVISKSSKKSGPPSVIKHQPILIPQGHAGRAARSVADRIKNPRLNGADLYVARLGCRSALSKSSPDDCCSTSDILQHVPADGPKPISGSLHDELLNPQAQMSSANNIPITKADRQPSVLASRPCYRCVSYMNSVGIKRVFWTTDTGEWECAKVRDLVDALDNLGVGAVSDATSAISNVFVTKHEVLMLRRMMGNG